MKPTRVKFAVDHLYNLGNFENTNVQVGIETDALPGESVDQAFDRVAEKVYVQLQRRLDEVVEALENKQK